MTIDFSEKLRTLKRAYPKPTLSAELRTHASDFRVNEILPFSPSGCGEHLFLQIEKIEANTDWIAKRLQREFGLSSREVGYAGKKDRHSISTQWFSLHLPGKEVELDKFEPDEDELNKTDMQEFKILKAIRHNKKLKTGSLKENQFEIVLRNISGKIDSQDIDRISKQGVPNYFGYQRFGFDANNLLVANDYLSQKIKIKNRNQRGMIISSARSLLFNLLLSKRIENGTWTQVIDGDCLMLDGSQSYFVTQTSSHEEQSRVKMGDVHISGLLAGRQDSDAQFKAKLIEDEILVQYPEWLSAFYRLNLTTGRRPLRCIPRNLSVEQSENQAVIKFSLNKGCYATSVIRELVDITDISLKDGIRNEKQETKKIEI